MAESIPGFSWLTRRLPFRPIEGGMWMRMNFSRAEYVTPVPDEIQDEFNILRARRLISQTRLLFLALLFTVPPVMYGGSPGAPYWARVILPIVIGILLLLGLLNLVPVKADKIDAIWARKFIFDTTWSSPVVAALCSTWCVVNWWHAAPDMRTYYPLILSMGSLATAYCLTSIRAAAIMNMAIGLIPIGLLMLLSGNRMDMIAAASLMVAAAFLLRMIIDQHGQWTELLMLKHEIRQQANTDPLTGLLNRRAFEEKMQGQMALGADSPFALVLLDLDGFKPVNDQHGHGAGDALLCAVGQRLSAAAGERAHVARMGGDEFAVLFPDQTAKSADRLSAKLLASLIQAFEIEGHQLRIGASAGSALWPTDGEAMKILFEKADRALYAVKEQQKAARRKSGKQSQRAA